MMKKPNLLSRLFSDEKNFERPFFLFLTLVLVGMYVWALLASPVLDSAWKIALFTGLMIVHITLYWVSAWVFAHRRWLAPYILVQGLIAFTIGMMIRVFGIGFGMYPGLIGLVIGMPVRRAWKIPTFAYILGLSLVNYIFVMGAGTIFWWVLAMVPIVLFVSMYVYLYLRQAEARTQAQSLLRDLESANRQLSEYAARVEDLTIADERQRMARELHDTLSQGLAGLILQLEAVDAHLASNRTPRAREILQQSMVKARATLAEARQAIDDLRQPKILDLAAAVRQEAEHFSAATGIPCQPIIELNADIPEPVVEAALKAISESLTNVARHARAKAVDLRLAESEDGMEIVICDDGVGFDPAGVEAGHYGLLGMRERVRLADGSLDVQSEPGRGTQIKIRFPFKKVAHA